MLAFLSFESLIGRESPIGQFVGRNDEKAFALNHASLAGQDNPRQSHQS
jgi:hypothetical protein